MKWPKIKVSELCEILDNKRKPITKRNRIEGPYPYYGATGILDYVEGYLFDEDLVLIGEDGAKWGAGDNSAFSITGKTWVNNHAHVVKPYRNKILDSWLIYYLNGEDLSDFITGMTVPKLNQGKLKEIFIPLPPLPEQKRIVALLDTVFADLEQTRTKTEQNLKNARELFDSYLQQVFSQKGDGWVTVNLKSITSKIGSGATPKGGAAAYKTEGMSLIRSMNVHDRKFKEKKLALIDDDQAEKLSNVEIHPNDVLLNITGASVARCCVVPAEYLPARVNQHVSIIRVNERTIKADLLCYLLTSKYYKDILLGIGEAGSTRQAITKVQIEKFEVSYPESMGNQDKFIHKITILEDDILKLQDIYNKKLNSIDELKKSILQKAFSGELTTNENKGAI